MTKEEIITKAKALHLPKNSYVVFGSCPLAMAGLRQAGDIDLFVSRKVFDKLKAIGWREQRNKVNNTQLVHDVFEAYDNWHFGSYNPTLEHVLVSATVIDGVPFASLEEVRTWKMTFGRPKDLIDVDLIDKSYNLSRV
jgi:hypothetical protein